ncbi:hypothetical protein SAMN05444342_3898 [Haladaptatus paucihalophilus DX253]|uniref:Uncharacterized protein n=1 Tax=Haladaptatus paucihalophilus DX253 TaxID=797209 RepID=A0A1M7AXV3_HALPU|nr:hypothetical protein SAMN05444342_3898 [Haladaptatus paucihalophilus DX253]
MTEGALATGEIGWGGCGVRGFGEPSKTNGNAVSTRCGCGFSDICTCGPMQIKYDSPVPVSYMKSAIPDCLFLSFSNTLSNERSRI